MVTLRTSSVDIEDHSGGRARKMPRGPPDGGGGAMGMPPHAINAGPPRGRVGPPPMGVGPPPMAPTGPRTTATSRRGGRTRARSPIVVTNGTSPSASARRPGSTEPNIRPNSVNGGGDRRGMHGNPENPSSAAAAAAAAAKAFSDSNNGGRTSQWPDRHVDERGYPPMAPGYMDKGPYMRGSSKKWPPNPHEDPKLSGHYSQHTYGPYGGGGGGGYEGGYHGNPYGDRRYRGGAERGSHPHHPYKDMRGGMGPDHRGGPPPEASRGPMYHPHHHGGAGEYHHRTYMGGSGRPTDGGGRRPGMSNQAHPGGPTPNNNSTNNNNSTSTGNSSNNNNNAKMGRGTPNPSGTAGSSTSGGGKSLVIGGTTPIHVPKPDVHPELAEQRPNRALTRSVFRNCDDPESTMAASNGGDELVVGDDANPQKIIMSFNTKTPTTSFEENNKKGEDAKRSASGQPLSPKDPPQLHSTTQQRASDVFERSPEGNKNETSIDIAPSFTLFNQSFDSLGENYLNVESTLHADSFGMMPTASTGGETDGMTNVLRTAFSTGNNSTQLLAPSASGHLTIGYSPVNSFGTAAPPRRDTSTSNMMVLGGPEARSSSPTQVFSSYNQAYSGSGNRSGPLDDSHLRMSVGSFGAHSYGRPAPYGETSSSQHGGYGPQGMAPMDRSPDDGSPHFYVFLRKYKVAFSGCSFLLPGLKNALLEKGADNNQNESDGNGPDAKKQPSGFPQLGEPTPHDLVIAKRRVESSICAFGGSSNGKDMSPIPNEPGSSNMQSSSIFREREKPSPEEPTATVTPSSSVASPPRQSSSAKQKARYEEELPGRYYENDSRLSWEFEENPPVEVAQSRDDQKAGKNGAERRNPTKSSDDASVASKRLGASSPPASKMRYRCKLCGQPKQNHVCPFQQSLARSIGINVYPAVNAFTAAEPGSIAPALSEMNNFTDLSEKGSVANESSPGRSGVPLTSPKQVTPESARPSPRQLQLGSPPTTPGRTPTRSNTGPVRRSGPSRGQKRPHGYDNRVPDDQGDLLFVEAMELKPQQFLSVSEISELNSADAFSYYSLPLPYAQRKRLSDNLFSLSNEIPKLTDECAQVLREAREKDKWDLAVAELMTQVIVVLHCRDGDHRFDGLRQYLLTLGIAC